MLVRSSITRLPIWRAASPRNNIQPGCQINRQGRLEQLSTCFEGGSASHVREAGPQRRLGHLLLRLESPESLSHRDGIAVLQKRALTRSVSMPLAGWSHIPG